MASASNTTNMSARDRAKERELAEARQNGQAAPEVDVNSGAMINPHNPDFITKRPWYLGDSGPSLQHHDTRGAATASEVSMAEADAHLRRRRGAWDARVGGGAVAVVEVGAWIEALYRGKTPWLPRASRRRCPRAAPKAGAGARSGLESLGKVAYDAKRDRWHGYDPSMHKETEDRYAELDAARARRKDKRQDARSKEARAAAKAERKQAKAAEKAAGGGDDDDDSDSDSDSDDSDDEGDDEFRLDDAEAGDFQKRIARQGGVGGAQMKTTVRNLRIREDTAKYLRNLDPDSAFYDPKTRAMRENPTPNVDPKDLVYAGDNFARATGDALELAATHCFAWDADPSRSSRKKFEAKKAALDREKQQAILDKYGAQDVDEDAAERQLRAAGAASEAYREFDGATSRGARPPEARVQRRGPRRAAAEPRRGRRGDRGAGGAEPPPSRAALYGAGQDVVLDEAKVRAAMARARAAPADAANDANDKKRKYNSFATTDVTAEDMDAYRRTRVAADDPMATFLGGEGA
ncbi:hypothetical protein JL722_8112 [Aureococcus anophagefferens]|nr:hypothetical protein JL722_8112 [Aureococcus anophagefferens]